MLWLCEFPVEHLLSHRLGAGRGRSGHLVCLSHTVPGRYLPLLSCSTNRLLGRQLFEAVSCIESNPLIQQLLLLVLILPSGAKQSTSLTLGAADSDELAPIPQHMPGSCFLGRVRALEGLRAKNPG